MSDPYYLMTPNELATLRALATDFHIHLMQRTLNAIEERGTFEMKADIWLALKPTDGCDI